MKIGSESPKILVIRFHAFGDMIASIPYLRGLRKQCPKATIHFLTTKRIDKIPREIDAFDEVYSIRGGVNSKLLFFFTVLTLAFLILRRYDYIIDLQNDKKSNFIRKYINCKSSVFDKYSALFCGERYKNAIEDCGFKIEPEFIAADAKGVLSSKLLSAAIDKETKVVVINPAGYYITRNWPLNNYLDMIGLMLAKYKVSILIIGDSRIEEKALLIEKQFPQETVNLVGKTSQLEAFQLLGHVDLIISEDSGLGHMAWIQGVKTLFLFGSTRADWTAPPYKHVINLTSTDLECGDCMQAQCIHGDVRCLTRYSPEFVFEKVEYLIN